MAGEWIKMRTDLADDPAVITLSDILELDPDHVVGKLHRLWSWADKHTVDGYATVTPALLDRYVGVADFANTLVTVGWLEVTDRSILIPKFNLHNGESAKKRCQTAKRMQNYRKRNSDDSSVTVASPDKNKRREEKRREDTKKKIEPLVSVTHSASASADGTCDEFACWWNIYPKKAGKQAAAKAYAKAVKFLRSRPPEAGAGADDPHGFLRQRTQEFADSPKGRGSYCPHPATWLNEGRYDDDQRTWQQGDERHDPRGVLSAAQQYLLQGAKNGQ